MKRLTKIFSFTTAICLKNVLGKSLENVVFEGAILKEQLWICLFWLSNFKNIFFKKMSFWESNFNKYLTCMPIGIVAGFDG